MTNRRSPRAHLMKYCNSRTCAGHRLKPTDILPLSTSTCIQQAELSEAEKDDKPTAYYKASPHHALIARHRGPFGRPSRSPFPPSTCALLRPASLQPLHWAARNKPPVDAPQVKQAPRPSTRPGAGQAAAQQSEQPAWAAHSDATTGGTTPQCHGRHDAAAWPHSGAQRPTQVAPAAVPPPDLHPVGWTASAPARSEAPARGQRLEEKAHTGRKTVRMLNAFLTRSRCRTAARPPLWGAAVPLEPLEPVDHPWICHMWCAKLSTGSRRLQAAWVAQQAVQ